MLSLRAAERPTLRAFVAAGAAAGLAAGIKLQRPDGLSRCRSWRRWPSSAAGTCSRAAAVARGCRPPASARSS
ncbi:MAG: hypothetical protein MZV64_13815 [Ignavibacteriales bacterium]|nr:hypothetical protein [Ignavibacteriales bacterium]